MRVIMFMASVTLFTFSLHLAVAGELDDAVMAGDQAQVRVLLAKGANANEDIDNNGSPLHLAAAYGFPGIAGDLIAAGADIEAEGDPAGAHPLHVAADTGNTEVVRLLLDHGAKVDARDRQQRTPLMLACRSGRVNAAETLLDHGADLKAVDAYQESAIHFIAASGQVDLAKLFVSRGADINSASPQSGQIPLHYATIHSQVEMIKFLAANGADLNAADHQGRTPLKEARSARIAELLRRLGASR